MGQTKGKQKVEPPLVPLVDWNFRQTPTTVVLDEQSCVDAHFITKTQQSFLVHLSEDEGHVITLRDGRTFEVLKQVKLSELQVELSHVRTPTCLSALRDTIAVGGSGPAHLFIRWNIKKQIFKAHLLRAHKDGLQQVLLFGEKLMATSSHDHSVKIWDIEKSTCVVTLTAIKHPSSIAISDSGQFCIGGKEGLLLIYDSRAFGFQPKKMDVDKTGRLGVSYVCFEPQGIRMAVGFTYLTPTLHTKEPQIPIAILHMEKYVLLNEWLAHIGNISYLNWEGGILFSMSEDADAIKLWNPDTGDLLTQLDIPGPRTVHMDPLRKGLIVSTKNSLLQLKMTQLTPEEKKAAQEERERKEREKKEKEQTTEIDKSTTLSKSRDNSSPTSSSSSPPVSASASSPPAPDTTNPPSPSKLSDSSSANVSRSSSSPSSSSTTTTTTTTTETK